MAETWKQIPSFPDYEASDQGRVRRVTRSMGTSGGKILKPSKNGSGYLCVSPCVNGTHHGRRIHTLVAETFIGPRPDGLVINHKNGIKTDNQPCNLEYCTVSEDHAHAYRIGLNAPHNKKLTDAQVLEIRRLRSSGVPQKNVAEMFGTSQWMIGDIVRGKRYRKLQEAAGLTFGTPPDQAEAARSKCRTIEQSCPDCGRIIRGSSGMASHRKSAHLGGYTLALTDEQRRDRSERAKRCGMAEKGRAAQGMIPKRAVAALIAGEDR